MRSKFTNLNPLDIDFGFTICMAKSLRVNDKNVVCLAQEFLSEYRERLFYFICTEY